MSVTFTLDDWEYLTAADKRAVVKLRRALFDFEPLANLPGVGMGMVGSLMTKELAEEGPYSRPAVAERGYRLTKKGWLASEWINGKRTAAYPET